MAQPNQLQQISIPDTKPINQQAYRWVMLALVSALYASFGLVSSAIAPLVNPIMQDLKLSYSEIGFILGSWQLTYIVMALIGGTLIDRWGIRKSLFAGVIVIGFSAILRYFTNGFLTLALCVALFGVGGPMISIGAPKTIAEWFTGKDRGTAMGIYLTAVSIGGLISLTTINSIFMPMTGGNWRLTFILMGLPAILFAFTWVFFAKEKGTQTSTEKISIFKVFTGIIRLFNVRIILIVGFLYFVVFHAMRYWLPTILENGGLSPAIAGIASGIPIVVGIPVVLFFPRIIPVHIRGYFLAVTFILSAILAFAIVHASGTLLTVELVFWGIVSNAGNPIIILILMDSPEIGAKYMGAAGGLYFCIAEIGGFAGPTLIGVIKSMSTFTTAALFLAGVAVVAGILCTLLRLKNASNKQTS